MSDCADTLCSGCCHRPWDHGVGLGVCAEGLQSQETGGGGGGSLAQQQGVLRTVVGRGATSSYFQEVKKGSPYSSWTSISPESKHRCEVTF